MDDKIHVMSIKDTFIENKIYLLITKIDTKIYDTCVDDMWSCIPPVSECHHLLNTSLPP